MKDKDKKNAGDQDLSPQGGDGDPNSDEELNFDEMSQEELAELAKNNYKSIKANFEKGAQKVIAEKKGVETKAEAIKKIVKDPSALLEVQELNNDLAEEILRDVYDGMSLEDFKSKHIEGNDDEISQKIFRHDLDKRLTRIKKQLPDDKAKKFQTNFNKLIAGEKLDSDNVDEFIADSLKSVSEGQKADGVGAIGTGVASTGKPKSSTKYQPSEQTDDFVRSVTGWSKPKTK